MFYERLKSLALEKNKSFNQIERDLNLSRNTLANYKKGQTPSSERALFLQIISMLVLTIYSEKQTK